jgi:hypothetical protein
VSDGAVNIEGLDKADVLAALYNASRPQGMGFLGYDPQPMTGGEAQELLDSGVHHFDYLKGRVMKLDLKSDSEFDPRLYDRDNGDGAAAHAIHLLREEGNPNSPEAQREHKLRTAKAAEETRGDMEAAPHSGSVKTGSDGIARVEMGYGDVADVVDEAI